jgi:hypothetical protein
MIIQLTRTLETWSRQRPGTTFSLMRVLQSLSRTSGHKRSAQSLGMTPTGVPVTINEL